MTILQLKYVIALANASSMREAASKLFVTQPALSSMIRELEEELQIQIFKRNNKGIALTSEGREFLTYAKQAVSQYLLIEDRYAKNERDKVHFSVSMQHYVFAVKAFLKAICEFSYDRYTYSVQETKTDEVLTNVRDLKSEIGIISYSKGNENLFKKLFREFGLSFHPLMIRDAYAYLWKDHPLADREEISLDDLREYPCISFDQST
ncbi:MAG: LysR family transcriptional regulator [Eubacterium sp.]|nr:LysR family transcriptional regulator [Eubacterium sp.]